MGDKIKRRELLRKAGQLGLAFAGMELLSNRGLSEMIESASAMAAEKSKIVVASGGTIASMVSRAIAKFGGMEKFVKKGARVIIKPNIGWARTPEQAANTHPDVVETLINLCRKAGAGSIHIYEFTCDNPAIAFKDSGIEDVCKRNNVPLISAHEKHLYGNYKIPRGKILKSVDALKPIMEADCYINVPIVKVHGGGTITVALKNQMGCIYNRGEFHGRGLHQCIADLATIMKPNLCVVDASRLLLTHGPKGPGKVKKENKIIVGTDCVALDSYSAKLLGLNPGDVEHIKMAFAHGLGQMDLSKVQIIEV